MRLLLASDNAHKRGELRDLLEAAGLRLRVATPRDVGGIPPVVEDAEDFAGNARKKAASAAAARRTWTLADDSGLEVERLDGAPGVRSARFAGEEASDEENNALLLARLSGLPPAERSASFVCTLALARPDATIAAVIEGRTRGRILERPRGESGFGYDPLFLFTEPDLPQTGRTFAELQREEKSAVSHRGRALRELVAQLPGIVGDELS